MPARESVPAADDLLSAPLGAAMSPGMVSFFAVTANVTPPVVVIGVEPVLRSSVPVNVTVPVNVNVTVPVKVKVNVQLLSGINACLPDMVFV